MKVIWILAALLALVGCENRKYPVEARSEFMTSCMGGGGSFARCSCTLEGLENLFTFAEFLQWEDQMNRGAPSPPEFFEIIAKCKATNP